MSHFKVFTEAEKLLSMSDPERKVKSLNSISIGEISIVNSDIVSKALQDEYVEESFSIDQKS